MNTDFTVTRARLLVFRVNQPCLQFREGRIAVRYLILLRGQLLVKQEMCCCPKHKEKRHTFATLSISA